MQTRYNLRPRKRTSCDAPIRKASATLPSSTTLASRPKAKKERKVPSQVAASAIFSIPELLEKILVELPPLEIVRCQGVNHLWQDVIVGSILLQYKAWLRDECPDATHDIGNDKVLPMTEANNKDKDNDPDFLARISEQFNPIFIASIKRDPLIQSSFSSDGDFVTLRPVVLRALAQWFETHKESEEKWGCIPLIRPNVEKVAWDLPFSDCESSVTFRLEARHAEKPEDEGKVLRRVTYRKAGESLALTLRDLMRAAAWQWEEWLDHEREIHYLSHDGEGCDSDCGLPDEDCLERQYEDPSDEDSDGDGDGRDHGECEKLREYMLKINLERAINSCVKRASRH